MIERRFQKGDADSVARYSTCERYRYALTRVWQPQGRKAVFIMLNPSTATEVQNDPTVERCERRARALGFGAFRVTNIFAWRDTDPQKMRAAADPVGPGNDAAILESLPWADQVIAAYTDPSFEVNPQGLIWPMVARGMGHLPLVELRYYYSVEQAMINALPSRECGQAMRGTYSDKAYADAMSRVAARLETDALREFYRIEFKAAKLGATRGPVALSTATMQDVAAAIDARVEALLDVEPDAVRLRAAMQDIARANNKNACRIGRIFYEAVITLDPKIQRNGLIMLGQQ